MSNKSAISQVQCPKRGPATSATKKGGGRSRRKPLVIPSEEELRDDPCLLLDLSPSVARAVAEREMRIAAEEQEAKVAAFAEKRRAYNARRRQERRERNAAMGKPTVVGGYRPGAGRKPSARTVARRAALAHTFL